MSAPSSPTTRLRTGLFEIDCSSGELFKNGRKLPLQEQPFRVLAMLLERPGEVVTREQLQARLWPADTYVSFDEGLNTAIRKLRLALGDSADNPRFIETLPKRGYRFIAPVNPVADFREASNDPIKTTANVQADAPSTEPGASARRSLTPPALWKLIFVAAASVAIVAAAVIFVRFHRSPKAASQKRMMLAILPFQNLSNDPAQEYFSDGLTEETITDLGQLSPQQLGVIARTSAMAYKHTQKTVGQIGQELGVDYILEGSVRREGGRARVSAQLIHVSDQTHLWAENYDRELKSVLEIESELGKTIAQEVQLNITPQRQLELSKQRTVDPDAYDLYLRGRFYWNQRTATAINESIGFFQQAVEKDPKFALAYAGLADAYNISNIVGALSPKESLPQA
jgi:TolB-like protein/DNA-binding winged helix-turn-helix (wHTH) protein